MAAGPPDAEGRLQEYDDALSLDAARIAARQLADALGVAVYIIENDADPGTYHLDYHASYGEEVAEEIRPWA